LFVFAAILGIAAFVFSTQVARSVDRGRNRTVFTTGPVAIADRAVPKAPPAPITPRVASSSRSAATPRSPGEVLAQQVQDFVRNVGTSLQNASKRRARDPSLQRIDRDLVHPPAEFGEYQRMVQQFATRGEFSSGHATRLETYGFGVFVAAVELLQDLDYEDSDACCEAACVHQLLAQMTKVEGLVLDDPAADPDAVTTRRFKVVADGWRQFAERFTHDDAGFKTLLQATGRLPAQR